MTGFGSGYYKGYGESAGGFCGLVRIDDYKSYCFCPRTCKWVHDEAFAFAWENATDYDKIDEQEALKIIRDWKVKRH